MIPQVQERNVISSGAKTSSTFEISADDTAHIMTILRDTLYSDKIMAVLREYGANAVDEMNKSGQGHVPIRVHMPTLADPMLRIRDVGPGLSPDEVERIFTKYGASTKREDNVAVGMLGIGSKSGFAYSDSFSVTSWHGGMRREYVAVIDESQKGRMDLLFETPCGDETGLEIGLAVRPQDLKEFERRAMLLFVHYPTKPDINITLPSLPPGKDVKALGRIYDTNDWNERGKWTAVMGCVPYRIDLNQLGQVRRPDGTLAGVSKCATNIMGLVRFGIGELQVAASREELKYGDATRIALIDRINETIDEFVKELLAGLDKLSQWERRITILGVQGKGLPIPKDKEEWGTPNVKLKPTLDPIANAKPDRNGLQYVVRITTRNYNDNMTPTDYVRIDRRSRIVIKDDTRTIKGFDLGEMDVMVSPAGGRSAQSALTEARCMIKDARIEGIPVVMLSSIKWVAPLSNAAPRDPAKARASMLVLDPKTDDFGAHPLSRHWEPVTRAMSDKDVWVVLEAYKVSDAGAFTDFYEVYRQDRQLVEGVGLVMPQIIGHKEMAAKPVVKSRLKGTDYWTWRRKGLVDLLKTHPQMKSVIEAIEDGGEMSYDVAVGQLEKELGPDHLLVGIGKRINAARAVVYKADRRMLSAVRTVRQIGRDSQQVETSGNLNVEVLARYPLLKTVAGIAALNHANVNLQLWIDYVLLVDTDPRITKAKQENEQAA